MYSHIHAHMLPPKHTLARPHTHARCVTCKHSKTYARLLARCACLHAARASKRAWHARTHARLLARSLTGTHANAHGPAASGSANEGVWLAFPLLPAHHKRLALCSHSRVEEGHLGKTSRSIVFSLKFLYIEAQCCSKRLPARLSVCRVRECAATRMQSR